MDAPLDLLMVLAGFDLPDLPEPTGTPAERFAALADAVVKFERSYARTYEGADPTTQRRLTRLRGQATTAIRTMAWVVASDCTEDDIEAFTQDARAAVTKLGITIPEGWD